MSATAEEGVAAMKRLSRLGPVWISTRRSGWSCAVYTDVDVADPDGDEPTIFAYGYEHGPHGAAATALKLADEAGLLDE